jgi:hypothetical protein
MFSVMKRRIKSLLRAHLKGLVESIIEEKFDQLFEIQLQLRKYADASEEEKASFWEKKFDAHKCIQRFENLGVSVENIEIIIQDFEAWMKMNPTLVAFYSNSGDVRIEKPLEHYLSWKYLNITESDTVIDVAAAGSPFARVLRQKGIRAYRQDLVYPAGIHGYEIGGDAGAMPVPDEFADVLTLHCAFECFQGDADVKFAQNLSRILTKGGRIGIIPLYIDIIPFVKTSPWCDKRTIQVEPEARWLWRDDQYRAPFSRHYSPESFAERIVSAMPNISMKVLFFTNLGELSAHWEKQRIYCHFMFKGEKP